MLKIGNSLKIYFRSINGLKIMKNRQNLIQLTLIKILRNKIMSNQSEYFCKG